VSLKGAVSAVAYPGDKEEKIRRIRNPKDIIPSSERPKFQDYDGWRTYLGRVIGEAVGPYEVQVILELSL
jgi:hypothetical protein